MSISGEEKTVAVAVGCGGRSRRAVRWAAENLGPFAHRLLLLHVIPSISSIRSPSEEQIPIEKLEREVVEVYVQDQKLKGPEVFFQFSSLCGKRKLETLVLEGESTDAAIMRGSSLTMNRAMIVNVRSGEGGDLPAPRTQHGRAGDTRYVEAKLYKTKIKRGEELKLDL